MRNDFTYDALHRVKTFTNTLLNPDAITGRYDETFIYDPAGNIKFLTRNGHTGNGVYEQIDDLAYTYSGEHLTNVTDNTISNTARPFGFRPDASGYTYDDNGNLKKDNGKKLNIRSNVLNLPQKVWNTLDETDYLKIDYTFAGEKIRKREYENGTIKEDRFYLGGVEFVNSIAETYSHPEGRIRIVQTPGEPFKYAFQYKIADHLGNMAVFFEDSDSDGIIATEDSDPANSEVLQRHFYYSFGMEMQGAWVQPSAPENQYQYNGKELNENLGLDWYEYGARMYDAAIGRFTGVDPIAEQFAFVTVYNYAENEPIGHIDLWGLQKADSEVGKMYELPNGGYGYEYKATGNSAIKLKDDPYWTYKNIDGETNQSMEYRWKEGMSDWELVHDSQATYESGIRNSEITGDVISYGLVISLGVPIGGLLMAETFGTAAIADYVIPGARIIKEVNEELNEEYVLLYHKGNLQTGRVGNYKLSTGESKEAVEALDRAGKVWEFKIPKNVFERWKFDDKVRRLNDYDNKTGTYNTEWRFNKDIAPELNRYIQKVD